MKRFGVRITLLDDTAFTERAGTVGGPKGLDCVPGSALLGVAAARLYATLAPHDAWRVFHSGAVRFGNALPLADGQTSYPLPLCWHSEKGKTFATDGRIDSDAVINALAADLGGPQKKQIRKGYVTPSGRLVRPELPIAMMTAIDPDTRRAAEEKLFSYQMLPEGTELLATIEADDSIDDRIWSALKEVFNGEIRLGRSRSAFGSARAVVVEAPTAVLHGDVGGRELVLWLLADLAAVTPDGVPTAQPQPEWLGLPAGELDLSRSFVRIRRYSPWNAKRGGYDLERIVIVQGSVLVFRLGSAPDATLGAKLDAGLGVYRQCGLGRVWANPPLLKGGNPQFASEGQVPTTIAAASVPHSQYEEALLAWMDAGIAASNVVKSRDLAADGFARALKRAYCDARAYVAAPKDVAVGPSPSQWGTLFQIARDGRGGWREKLRVGLNEKTDGWKTEVAPQTSFAWWFMKELEGRVQGDDDWRTVQGCLRRALDIATREHDPVSKEHDR